MRFKNKIVLITGGASGIGLATAKSFADEGAQVYALDLSQKEPSPATFIKCDVSSEEDIKNAVNHVVTLHQKIDVMVNNAAIMTFCPVMDIKTEDWDRVMTTNLRSVFLFTKYCLPHMKAGAIINISSVHAHETTANNAPYASSKGAMEAFCRAVSLDIPISHARINCVAPGAVNTPMLWNNPNVKSGKEKIQGKIGEPQDLANAILFMASSEARFINGTTLIVDGGRLDIL